MGTEGMDGQGGWLGAISPTASSDKTPVSVTDLLSKVGDVDSSDEEDDKFSFTVDTVTEEQALDTLTTCATLLKDHQKNLKATFKIWKLSGHYQKAREAIKNVNHEEPQELFGYVREIRMYTEEMMDKLRSGLIEGLSEIAAAAVPELTGGIDRVNKAILDMVEKRGNAVMIDESAKDNVRGALKVLTTVVNTTIAAVHLNPSLRKDGGSGLPPSLDYGRAGLRADGDDASIGSRDSSKGSLATEEMNTYQLGMGGSKTMNYDPFFMGASNLRGAYGAYMGQSQQHAPGGQMTGQPNQSAELPELPPHMMPHMAQQIQQQQQHAQQLQQARQQREQEQQTFQLQIQQLQSTMQAQIEAQKAQFELMQKQMANSQTPQDTPAGATKFSAPLFNPSGDGGGEESSDDTSELTDPDSPAVTAMAALTMTPHYSSPTA